MMMIKLRSRPSSESARRRTRWLWRALFVLLALHAVLVYAVPEFPMLTRRGVGWLLAGGIVYSIGVLFYFWERLLFGHGVWHLFVLIASACPVRHSVLALIEVEA